MRRISASASRPVCSTTSSASQHLLLVGVEQPPDGRGLDGHHADAVPDDVVELARDPGALLGDGEPRLLLALELGLLGEPPGHVGRPEPLAVGKADDPCDREGDQRPDVVAVGIRLRIVVRDHRRDGLHRHEPCDRLAEIGPHPEPGRDAERSQKGREVVVDEPGVDERGSRDHGERDERRRHREPAAEEQGQKKPSVIRTSSQIGPSAPLGSGPFAAIPRETPIPARMSASTQNRRTSEESRLTRPGSSRATGSRRPPAGPLRAGRRRWRPARASRPVRGRRCRRRRRRSRRP